MAHPGKGPAPPLFLGQTEIRKAEKKFSETAPPHPLSQGLDDRDPLTAVSALNHLLRYSENTVGIVSVYENIY